MVGSKSRGSLQKRARSPATRRITLSSIPNGFKLVCLLGVLAVVWNLLDPLSSSVILVIHALVVVIVLETVRYDPAHPVAAYSVVFFIYALAYPVLVDAGWLEDRGVTEKVVLLHYYGYLAFLIPTFLIKRKVRTSVPRYYKADLEPVLKLAIGVLATLTLSQILLVGVSGAYTGSGVDAEGDFIGGTAGQFLITVYAVYATLMIDRGKLGMLQATLLCGAVFAVGFFVSGDRSLLMKFLIVWCVIYQFRRPSVNRYTAIAAVLVVFVAFGLSKSIGGVISGKNTQEVTSSFSSLDDAYATLLYREFKTSGRITAVALEFFEGKPSYGSILVQNLVVSLIPSQLRDGDSFIKKFNLLVRDTDVGLGYSTIADGYLNFGVSGVLLFMSFIGWSLVFFYSKADFSPLALAMYAVVLATACITVRNGLAGYLASVVKSVFFPIVLIAIARYVKPARSEQNVPEIKGFSLTRPARVR